MTSPITCLLLMCLFLTASVNGQDVSAKPVKVSVYYEALCPDSINFIRNQLWPSYQSIKEIMDVDLVAYGKATHRRQDGKVLFECQHGPDECKGNKMQACALKLYPKESAIAFVKCVMTRRRPHEAGETCARQLKLEFSPLDSCTSGTEGDEYLALLGDRTHNLSPKLNFVPWINLDDKHDDDKQWESLRDLTRVVCDAYNSTSKPSGCP